MAVAALVGLVRVSADKREKGRQHDAMCVKCSRRSRADSDDDRPGIRGAFAYLRPPPAHCAEVDRLDRNRLEGLVVLDHLFKRGVSVKVLEGVVAGEHTERPLVVDMALALAEDC
ncbi:recombinase family protein [Gordonia otitidis]|uniref:Resolvase/invertase-type recombinase catalytic domain-containing protein n=1 Tax=Gordonia otitidis (strain DSM 44809 / CCUG 52243 / JCM 12355 / NBRC 100426 / IFM 10032) TaxID=1108044 RepID=H5THI4_GORO1|nr:recombinase family protein [Gordonia otitidis]GAB32942.1 hypothetical protein GOOTI_034_00090 [Gordonia otitidis NBRC 100426]